MKNSIPGRIYRHISFYILIGLCCLLIPSLASAELKVHFIDVGQGDAILVQCDGQTLLVDAGPAESGSIINTYLTDTLAIDSVDFVIATHAHDDHLAGMQEALRGLSVGHVFSSTAISSTYWFSIIMPVLNQDGLEVSFPAPLESFQLGGAVITFINTLTAAENPNDLSLAVRVEYGENAVLLMADIEAEAETHILGSGAPLKADILKVAHHGGNTSTTEAFVRAVSPQIAVISVGKGNPHDHPHMEPLRTLEKYNVTIYRTDQFGTIVATSNGTTWSIEVSKVR